MSNKIIFKLILIPLVVILLLGGILIYFSINGQPKTIATYEQVWDVIEKKGIIPTDTTEMFKEGWKDSRSETLQKALTFKNPDLKTNISQIIIAYYWALIKFSKSPANKGFFRKQLISICYDLLFRFPLARKYYKGKIKGKNHQNFKF